MLMFATCLIFNYFIYYYLFYLQEEFYEQVSKIEREISEKTKQLKQMIDRHEETLLAELKSIKQKRTKEIEAAYEEVECHLTARQS